MTDDLNSVKSSRAYHHGALRPALIAAAEAVLAERGTHGFSLRETARRAGVSPAAPAHHFGDASGLLTAVAAGAFRDLADALEAAAPTGGREIRIRAQGLAYVRFALANRARFDLMWRAALLDRDDPDYAAAAARAFLLLDRAVRGGEGAAEGPGGPETAPSIACWSMVHGFARLALDGGFGTAPGAVEAALEGLLPAVLDHLAV
ncbi:MAG TPA: TetR/AcrR family transcriptional regulator [Allosphingosinicella sp.]|jgi:AcrR family transcriptional regulator|nr:TetR/AcrR family transcriptional regulator [Allosphingosinicella sp.]